MSAGPTERGDEAGVEGRTVAGEPVVVERWIAAPPDVVYAYLTEAGRWARWQGTGVDLDAEPGGSLLIAMPGGQRASGRFVELVPGERVVFTWGWLDHADLPPGSSTVEIVLAADAGGTRLRLSHRGLPEAQVRPHARGWQRYVPRLAVATEGRDPGPDRP